MFTRTITETLLNYAKFPVVAVLGPRQSGKTTLVQLFFKNYTYVSFEDPDTRDLAANDPRQFLRIHENNYGIIIDEFQYVPQILSYIQLEVDAKKRPGYFILTGSQNFLVNQAITQSLAGRVGILTLLPLSIQELENNNLLSSNVDEVMFKGGYPRLYDENLSPIQFYSSYIQTYVERDVRQLINVVNLRSFQRFIQLCAGRIGQLLNLSEIAGVCGISSTTANQWISLLEASYIVFLLRPHFKNFNKRITKSPKIYFFDTGLACSLLTLDSPQVLALHPLRGNIFECFIIADLYKQYYNRGLQPPLYFWRDQNGRLEVDCIVDTGLSLIPIEIKSGETVGADFFKNLKEWNELTQTSPDHNYLFYGGNLKQSRSAGNLIGWEKIGTFVGDIKK